MKDKPDRTELPPPGNSVIERLRGRVDIMTEWVRYEISPDEWLGPEWWQYGPSDEERYGLSVQDMPLLQAIWQVFEGLCTGSWHGSDGGFRRQAFDIMPWLEGPVTERTFVRFAELMNADGRKARGLYAKLGDYETSAARVADHRDPDLEIPF